jgi:hypothetical protein
VVRKSHRKSISGVIEGLRNPEQVPIPVVEIAPQSVLVHFPYKDKDKLIWSGMQLTSEEASHFGFKLLQAAEESSLTELDG